jgi:hypothetical protein
MLFGKRPSVVSFRIALLVSAAGALIALVIGAPEARAFPTYSGWWLGECRTCHGDFGADNYQPPSRDQQWTGENLHDVHRFQMVFDCLACHMAFPIPTRAVVSMSDSGSAAFPMSCIGCHGRAEHDAGGLVTAAGLRRKHWNGGVPCTPCHADSEPAFGFTPVGEQVFPPNYDALDIDPCNPPSDPEDFAGSTLGLDNDGDGYYDGDDLDCVAPQPPSRCGLGIELALLLPPLGWLGRRRRRAAAWPLGR